MSKSDNLQIADARARRGHEYGGLRAPDTAFEDRIRQNDGCKHSTSCLTCPRVRCVHDGPERQTSPNTVRRDDRISLLFDQQVSIDQIARQTGVTERTVYRALNRSRAARLGRGSKEGS